MFADARAPHAFRAPLGHRFRERLHAVGLPDDAIVACIDGWPDPDKESLRQALVEAVDESRIVRFRWFLTDAPNYQTRIEYESGTVTITALSPRSTLTIFNGDRIAVGPVPPRATQTSP